MFKIDDGNIKAAIRILASDDGSALPTLCRHCSNVILLLHQVGNAMPSPLSFLLSSSPRKMPLQPIVLFQQGQQAVPMAFDSSIFKTSLRIK